MCLGQMRKLETGLETQPTAGTPPHTSPYELMREAICISQKVSRKKVHRGNKEEFLRSTRGNEAWLAFVRAPAGDAL